MCTDIFNSKTSCTKCKKDSFYGNKLGKLNFKGWGYNHDTQNKVKKYPATLQSNDGITKGAAEALEMLARNHFIAFSAFDKETSSKIDDYML